MNFENLQKMELNELKTLAMQSGVHVHHKAKKDLVIKKIMEATLTPQTQPQENKFKDEDMRPKYARAKKPEYNYTEEDVREACAEYFQKDGFTAQFMGDGTVVFKCKGAEDSLTLKQPMAVIKRKAQIVSRGRLALYGLNNHFDSLPVHGNNLYTSTVLS